MVQIRLDSPPKSKPCGLGFATMGILRGKTLLSNIAGLRADTIVSQRWQQTSFVAGSLSSLPKARLEIMKELMPPLTRAGVLLNPDNAAMPSIVHAMTQTANQVNVTLQSIGVQDLNELEPAIERGRSQFDAIVVVEDGLFVANRTRIAELAIKNRLPSIVPHRGGRRPHS